MCFKVKKALPFSPSKRFITLAIGLFEYDSFNLSARIAKLSVAYFFGAILMKSGFILGPSSLATQEGILCEDMLKGLTEVPASRATCNHGCDLAPFPFH